MREGEKSGLGLPDDARTLGVYFPDLNGIPRGKEIVAGEIEHAIAEGFCLTASVFALDYGGDAVMGSGLGPEILFRDLVVRPDLATACECPWMPSGAVALADVDYDGEPAPFAPRTLLRKVVNDYRELGLEPIVGVELEFHLLHPTDAGGLEPYDDVAGALYMPLGRSLDPHGVIATIHGWAERMWLPLTKLTREFNPGQYELNLAHGPALAAVDSAYLFKLAVKEAAAKAGLLATFMGRPLTQLGGSGLHFHVSLNGPDGENAFADTAGPHGLSDAALRFVAGCHAHLAGSTAVMAPNVNSYKRFTTISLAPYYLTWGLDNRTATLRVPPERGAATRVEHRLPDAAANLHTSAALVLAAGLDGIRRELDAGEPFVGDASVMAELDEPKVPASLPDAMRALEADETLTAFLGPQFMQTFLALKRAEVRRFASVVTEWETKQYARHL
jgi:glutamine synthetase